MEGINNTFINFILIAWIIANVYTVFVDGFCDKAECQTQNNKLIPANEAISAEEVPPSDFGRTWRSSRSIIAEGNTPNRGFLDLDHRGLGDRRKPRAPQNERPSAPRGRQHSKGAGVGRYMKGKCDDRGVCTLAIVSDGGERGFSLSFSLVFHVLSFNKLFFSLFCLSNLRLRTAHPSLNCQSISKGWIEDIIRSKLE